MADIYANNRKKVSIAARAGGNVMNPHVWDVVAASNGDKVYIGDLPAGHQLTAEVCSVIANGATGAMTFSVCIGQDADAIFAGVAVTAATFSRTGCTTYQKCYELGTSPVNRSVYLLLTVAPTVAGGKIVVNLKSAAIG